MKHSRLLKLVSYFPETGEFTSLINHNRRWTSGRKLGWTSKRGCTILRLDGKDYKAHRLAWLYMTGKWPRKRIDHKDGSPTNNQWSNLREATHSQNLANRPVTSRSVSKIKGVGFSRGRWRARIMVNYKEIWLGYFETKEAAADAYKKAAEQHFGEFARF